MKKAEIKQHISRQFNQELEGVRSKVLAMGGLVEEQIRKAMEALVNQDSQLGEKVVADDAEVNRLEVAIDEECGRILALRQPTAGDLRLVVAIIKTITDLERIGDEAEKIGWLASRLASLEAPAARYREIRHIANLVRTMVHESLNAFARMDPEAAYEVAKQDQEVDREYEALLRQLITVMMEDPRSIRGVLDVMWAARALERIGDHAKNICEYVIYLVHGKDIRHIGIRGSASLDELEGEAEKRE